MARMISTESIVQRRVEAEVEKEPLRAQLFPTHKSRGQEEPRRQTIFVRDSSLNNITLQHTESTQQASQSPLLDLFTHHERYNLVFDNIYQRLDIKDVISISRTCKKLSSFYKNMLPCQWNINRRLARFVNDPKEFRSRLGEADALISGTFALLFFAQLYWLDSGLDIYVRQGSKANALIRYISSDKSYEFDHSYSWSDNDQQRTLTKVLIFRRIVPPGSPQIRFHLTRTSPLHSILTDCAFSSAHVNIITWNKAYCMFPNVTFVDRRMYFLHIPDEALGQILSKYSAHGWRTSDWVDYDQARGCNKPGIRENFRRIGDSSTWIIPLNLHNIRTPSRPDFVLESCTFQIFPDSGPSGSQHMGLKTFGIGAQTFSCCMLKYAYTFHAPNASWVVFLREKLSRMIMLEVLKTGDADLIASTRQPDFMSGGHRDCPLLRSRPHLERPDGWECVDHMVPAWLEEWKSAGRERIGESTDLLPHPLTIVHSKGQPGTLQALTIESVPPPVPPRRARRTDTDRSPSKPIPASLLSPRSGQPPLSSETTTASSVTLPRSISTDQMNQLKSTSNKLAVSVSPKYHVVSAPAQPSKSGCSLPRVHTESLLSASEHLAQGPRSSGLQYYRPQLIRSVTSPQFSKPRVSPQVSTPPISPQKRKADSSSLIKRRPKVSRPPPLDLSSTRLGPLLPDLLTPPPDTPLPAILTGRQLKRSPVYIPSHLPWGSFEKDIHNISGGQGSLSSDSIASEKITRWV